MAGVEQFDFVGFGASLRGVPRHDQRERVHEELGRVRNMPVREPSWKFKQHIYLRRLERLGRHLAGEDVSLELTPTEIEAYTLLSSPPEPAARPAQAGAGHEPAAAAGVHAPPVVGAATAAAGAAKAPTAAAPAPEPPRPGADERRRSRRIQMRTRARIRRESDGGSEVLEPVNVSRGGLAFCSSHVYALHEKIFVNMHFQPNQPESDAIESHGLIVRAAPVAGSPLYSYGVKFIA